MSYLDDLRAEREDLIEQRASAVKDMEAVTSAIEQENEKREEGTKPRTALTEAEEATFSEARDAIKSVDDQLPAVDERIAELEGIQSRARESGRKIPNVIPSHDDAPVDARDLARLPAGELRDRSMRILEDEDRTGTAGLSSEGKDAVDGLLRRSRRIQDGFDPSHIALRMITTENEHYQSAFTKSLEAGMNGRAAYYTNEEVRALQAFDEARALAGQVDTAGGYGIPVLIDPTIVLTSQGHVAVILQDCTHKTITTDAWKGVTSAGMTWSYDGEAVEVSDDTPTLAQPSIPVWPTAGFLPYSIEVGEDYPGFAAELGNVLMESYRDDAAKYSAIGTGSSQPKGWQVALDANTNVEVVVTTDGGFAVQDVSKAWTALHERYRGNATWYMHTDVGEAIAAFATSTNLASFTTDLTGSVQKIRNRPVKFSDYLQTFVSGSTGALNILSVGDARGYGWITRTGMTVEPVPHLFGTSNPGRPTRQRGLLAHARNGGDFINIFAARLLQNQ